ncbi:MAG TPA: type II toxin-antitoxin system RelE/ParE family toxin [Hanamia sp.]|nr:type II toxin-antitoxin system RelE/ParE family toxin [Hanamia sp.]
MNFKLSISPTAFSETNDAYIYYTNISEALGERFLKSLEATYDKLSRTPKYYSYINEFKDLRDTKLKDFPYVVIFQIIDNRVLVLRVFNTNRNPVSPKNL